MAVTATFIGTTQVISGSQITDLTSVAAGSAAGDRIIAIFGATSFSTPGNFKINGALAYIPSGTEYLSAAQWWWALVPSGTTVDLHMEFAIPSPSISLGLYAITGADPGRPYSTVYSHNNAAANVAIAMAVESNGALIAGVQGPAASSGGVTMGWTNATEDDDNDFTATGNARGYSVASIIGGAGGFSGTVTATATGTFSSPQMQMMALSLRAASQVPLSQGALIHRPARTLVY